MYREISRNLITKKQAWKIWLNENVMWKKNAIVLKMHEKNQQINKERHNDEAKILFDWKEGVGHLQRKSTKVERKKTWI